MQVQLPIPITTMPQCRLLAIDNESVRHIGADLDVYRCNTYSTYIDTALPDTLFFRRTKDILIVRAAAHTFYGRRVLLQQFLL